MEKKMRVQLAMLERRVRHMEKLMEELDIKTKQEFFNYALMSFEWIIQERRKGRIIQSLDQSTGDTSEVIMPPLQSAFDVNPPPPVVVAEGALSPAPETVLVRKGFGKWAEENNASVLSPGATGELSKLATVLLEMKLEQSEIKDRQSDIIALVEARR